MSEFETMLAIAHERLVMLDELKACNISMVYLRGVVTGVFATLLTVGIGYGLWRLI